jgi:hypothetical protein
MLIGSVKRRLAIDWLTNLILTFAFVFIVRPIISLIVFKKLQNMMENNEQ